MFVVALGWFAAALAALVALPQVIKLIRSRTTAGISVTAWRLTFATSLGWVGHGLAVGYANIWLPNVIFLICSGMILVQLRRDRSLGWFVTFGPSLLVGCAALGVDALFGPVVFAIAAGMPSLIAQVMQLRELVIAPQISGVSVPFLALSAINQAIWLIWGLLAGEQSIIVATISLGSLMTMNLVWALLRKTGIVRGALATSSV